MELIYMYVESFQGIIKDFEYNFSTKFEIKYDKEIQELTVLNQQDNKNPRFFGNNIENVTAIIGKNGAGKSSILRVLSMKYTGLKKRMDNYILVYHVEENIFYIEAYDEDLYKLNIKCREQYSNKIKPYLEGVYVELYDNKFILTNRSHQTIEDTCILASLNTVVNGYGSSKEREIISRIGLNEGWEYQYRFLAYAKGNEYDAFKNDIRIELFINSKYEFKDSLMNVNDTLFARVMRKFSNKERFILSLIYQQIKRISIEVINYYKNSDPKNIEEEIQGWFEYMSKSNYEESINCAKNTYNKILSYINKPTRNNINEENNVPYLMDIIDSLNDLEEKQFVGDYLSIKISDKEDYNVVKFFNMLDRGRFRGYSDITSTLDIKINHLSDGESAFIKLFASIYSKIGNHKNIILVLDEPDKSFHPEWSRRFITYLRENLEIFDTDQIRRRYQIILTTHSPFIASDLPKKNILTIEDCKIKDIDLGNTFGANIHMLLSNQFFMESTIGEFARQKINECIVELSKKINDSKYEIDDEKIDKIEYIIKNIGEPIIKNKLENMYKEVFPKNEDDYLYRIKRLEEEKYKLENLLKDKKLDNIDEVMELLNRQIDILKKKSGENK